MPVAPDEEAVVRCETTKGPVIMKFERVRLKIQVSLNIVPGMLMSRGFVAYASVPLENFLTFNFSMLLMIHCSYGRLMGTTAPSSFLNENSLTAAIFSAWFQTF